MTGENKMQWVRVQDKKKGKEKALTIRQIQMIYLDYLSNQNHMIILWG